MNDLLLGLLYFVGLCLVAALAIKGLIWLFKAAAMAITIGVVWVCEKAYAVASYPFHVIACKVKKETPDFTTYFNHFMSKEGYEKHLEYSSQPFDMDAYCADNPASETKSESVLGKIFNNPYKSNTFTVYRYDGGSSVKLSTHSSVDSAIRDAENVLSVYGKTKSRMSVSVVEDSTGSTVWNQSN